MYQDKCKLIEISDRKEFFKSIYRLYDDFHSRVDLEKWNSILESPAGWRIRCLNEGYEELFKFFLYHRNFPTEIWLLIEEKCNFTMYKDKFKKKFGKRIVEEVFINIERPSYLSYDFLDDISCFDINDYLCFRQLIYYNLLNGELTKIEKYINKAYYIYKRDPELLRLMGEYYFITKDSLLADKYLKEAISINEDDYIAKKVLIKNNEYLAESKNQNIVHLDYIHVPTMFWKSVLVKIIGVVMILWSTFSFIKAVIRKIYYLFFL